MESLIVHGVRVPVSQNEVSPAIWDALHSGSYEQTEARLAPKAVRQFDRILELGAGFGVVTSVMAAIKGVQIFHGAGMSSTTQAGIDLLARDHGTCSRLCEDCGSS